MQLLVQGTMDAVRVTSAWTRDFGYRAARVPARPTGWIRIYDTSGLELAKVHFDLSTVNRDRGVRKGKDIVFGDVIREGRVTRLVKIPDFGPRMARMSIESVEASGRVVLATVTRAELDRVVLASKLAEPLGNVTVRTHIRNGPSDNRYDIVVLGDAYRASEESKFVSDVNNWTANLFAKEPFRTYRNFFNVHSVFRASNQHLADKPGPCQNPPIVRDTVYDASYCTGGTDRCVYIRNTGLASQDAARAPDVEGRVAVFVNDPKYGGCAGTFAVSYNGSSGSEVQTHEFGHSFAGLADEYGGGGTYTGSEPREVNVTADRSCAKWRSWIGHNGVGCFEGGRYHNRGIWRPKSNCIMRSLGVPFCEICREECVLDGYRTVSPIESPLPAASSVTVDKPATQAFRFTNLVPASSSSRVRWYVDNTLVQSGGQSYAFASQTRSDGAHTVRVEVFDQTAMVRKDTARLRTHTRTWNVLVRDLSKLGQYSTYGAGCVGSGTLRQVAPAAFARRIGDISESLPFAPGAVRYQQIVDGAALASARFNGLELRHGGFTGASLGGPRSVRIVLGQSDATPATLGQRFDANFRAGTTREVFRGVVQFPFRIGANTDPSNFAVTIPFTAPYMHAPSATRDLVIEVENSSGSTLSYSFDATAVGETAQLVAFSRTATSGTVTRRRGLVLGFRSSGQVRVALDHVGVPTTGRAFQVNLAGAPANAIAALWLGFTKASLPLPGSLAPNCTLYTSFEILPLAVRSTDRNGMATVDIPIPNDAGLSGARFHNQWFVLDRPANALGMTFTNGGEAKVGTQ